jgi:hypothetical protein
MLLGALHEGKMANALATERRLLPQIVAQNPETQE